MGPRVAAAMSSSVVLAAVLTVSSEPDSPVPRAVVALAHSMGMDVVAEGIEHPHQLARVKEMGCEMGQGYLFSRPLTVDAFAHWIRANHSV